MTDKPMTVEDLIKELQKIEPKTIIVTEDGLNVLSFKKVKEIKMNVSNMVPGHHEGRLTFPYVGNNPKDIVKVLVIRS